MNKLSSIKDEDFILETKRLILRPIIEEDCDDLWPHVRNPRISRFMSWNPHENKNETMTLIKRLIDNKKNNTGITWSIFHKEEKDFCGIFSLISIMGSHRSCIYDRGELACWCAMKYQIDRIMDEAGHEIIKFCFEKLDLHKIMNMHWNVNIASEKFLKRLGFILWGEEKEAFEKNGVLYDMKHYDLKKSDYFKKFNTRKNILQSKT